MPPQFKREKRVGKRLSNKQRFIYFFSNAILINLKALLVLNAAVVPIIRDKRNLMVRQSVAGWHGRVLDKSVSRRGPCLLAADLCPDRGAVRTPIFH